MKKLIIGISGKKQSGKNTAANQIAALLWNAVYPHDMQLVVSAVSGELDGEHGLCDVWGVLEGEVCCVSFADPIKRFCIDYLGLTEEQCYGTDEQKDSLTELHRAWGQRHGRMTARQVLQYFGTEMMREWKPDIWTSAAIRQAEECPEPLVLITDVRFPNEADVIQEAGGKVIRLLRDPCGDQHESETALDNYDRWGNGFMLDNTNKTIPQQGEALRPIVEQWFREYGLIEGEQ